MSQTLDFLIVDDEPAARTVLRFLLEACFENDQIVGEAGSAIEGIKLIQKLKPDLVFLDISMPHADGFDLLESLPDRSFDVIFTTSHQDYAIRAIREGAMDYLLKPIDEDDLIQAVERVKNRKAVAEIPSTEEAVWEQKIKVTAGKEAVYIPLYDIIRLEAEGSYSILITSEKRSFTVSKNLRHFENLLAPLPFFRIHNSHLINLKMVEGFVNEDGGFVRMRDGSLVPASSRKVADFHRAMQEYLR